MTDAMDVRVRSSNAFNAADADVVVRSSDNINFHLHKRNLEFATGAFPPAETVVNTNETIQLAESAATLEILFQFIYPRRFPSLEKLEFEPLMLLAEAGQKYEVFSLINACQFQLRKFKLQHPNRILEFAAQHDLQDLIVELIPNLVHMPLKTLALILSPSTFKSWSVYREQWLIQVMKSAAKLTPHNCLPAPQIITSMTQHPISHVTLHQSMITTVLDAPFGNNESENLTIKYGNRGCCSSVIRSWKAELERIKDSMPPVESFT